jgi:hypothetical protein
MAWWDSVVRIGLRGALGSGVFVGADLVLTAGHVVQPRGSTAPPIEDVTVWVPLLGGTAIGVRGIAIHPRWQSSNYFLADMALVRVDRIGGVGLGVWRDFYPDGSPQEVSLYGYPADSNVPFYRQPFISVVTDQSVPQYRTIETAHLSIPRGVSGSPFVTANDDGNVYVAGIATRDPHESPVPVFAGLPLLASTFDQLVDSNP